ncbi:MAG: efflux RND transporter periplasmic adaptor subunit [Verrucomicrobia bacterium]|nr:efflux RND transporter periplasmic adaptor subunit [Verrucomicrobiota bacterium]
MNTRILIFLSLLTLPACKPPGAGMSRFETTTVGKGDLRAVVTASGTLSAVVSVDVGCQVSGRVMKLYADFNSTVKRGDLIAELDTSIYAAKLKAAEGELAGAKASAMWKRQNLARKKELLPMRGVMALDVEQAVAELGQAEATVTIREAALDQAKTDLGFCSISAPVDGIVVSRKVDAGQTVVAAMNTPVLFTLAQDIKKMRINATVSEADIGRVKTGQKVDFTVDAFPDDVFEGQVVQVRISPTTKENVVTYETLIDVENPEQRLFPGMTADVSILTAEKSGVLKVPNTALRFTPPEGSKVTGKADAKLQRRQQLVYVLEGADQEQTLRAVIVTTGITDNSETEVLDGLEAAARVVTASLGGTKEGAEGPPPSL